jgi:hypothetical protein
MARGATEASKLGHVVGGVLEVFFQSRAQLRLLVLQIAQDRPAVRRCRVLVERLSRLDVTSRPACSSSPESFWLSAPRRVTEIGFQCGDRAPWSEQRLPAPAPKGRYQG